MDETAPATSSALRRKELLSPSVSEPFLFNFSTLEEGGLTLYAGAFQIVMGITSNDYSTVLPEESFSFTAEPKRGCQLKALGISAGGDNTCPDIQTWVEGEEKDAPNFGTLPQAGRSFSTESKFFCFTLWDFRDSVSTRARSSPLVGLATEGPMGEIFIVEGGEGLKAVEQIDLELEGPGISDLISSA